MLHLTKSRARRSLHIRLTSAAPIALGIVFLFAGPACEQRTEEQPATQDNAEQQSADRAQAPATTPEAPQPAATDSTTTEAPADDAWPWTVPADWEFDAEPRPMRLATYQMPTDAGPVEVAMTRFPGRVGGELANINRWRRQAGQPPVDAADLESVIERFEAPGFDGYHTRIDSTAGVFLAAGVYDQSADQTWFVRTTIPKAAATDELVDEVLDVARSIANAP